MPTSLIISYGKKLFPAILTFLLFSGIAARSQTLAPAPPMGWLSWNFFSDNITEVDIREMADAMVNSGLAKAGYQYIIIDDGWQGGRDNRNNILPDPVKFPSGIKALADYVHNRGLKLGIYSDAAPLTCAGYTGSLHFEEQDAKTFASWGIDYFKYDYCNAPVDSATAKERYKIMAGALRASGRNIVFGICEWGDRQPWHWAAQAGGQLWRTTADIRDKWKKKKEESWGNGIIDNFEINATLNEFAGAGRWNDPDMLIVGLYGKKGPSGDGGGTGCSDTEYQSQMSLWCLMAAPLFATNDLRNMNEATRKILMNSEAIAIDQDQAGIQARLKIINDSCRALVKPLAGGGYAIGFLNLGNKPANLNIDLGLLGLEGKYSLRDVWLHSDIAHGKQIRVRVNSHETRLFRLKPE